MFNLFKKKDSQAKSQNDCYLISSGEFEKKILDEDKIEYYNEWLQSSEVPEQNKIGIRSFLIPNKISFLKFRLNGDYYNNPNEITMDFENEHKYIAPSLKIIKKNPNFSFLNFSGYSKWNAITFPDPDLTLQAYLTKKDVIIYPNWFVIAFPDVVLWAMKDKGLELIKKKYQNISEYKSVKGNFVKEDVLHWIIKIYLKNTTKSLECRKY